VTTVGEYLMALPQQLEVLMGGTGGAGEGGKQQQQVEEEEGDELAAEWLDKVGVGHEGRGGGVGGSGIIMMCGWGWKGNTSWPCPSSMKEAM
jgi:hypothetical protein